MACDCIQKGNEMLAKHKTGVVVGTQFTVTSGKEYPIIPTYTADGKEGPPLIPSYCPFCGKRYEEEDA